MFLCHTKSGNESIMKIETTSFPGTQQKLLHRTVNRLCFYVTEVFFLDVQIAEQKMKKIKKFGSISFAVAKSVETYPGVEVSKRHKIF